MVGFLKMIIGGGSMCYTCGCKMPYERHGDKKNLVEEDLKQAGETEAIEKAGKVKAKENMIELLKLQEERDEFDEPKEQY